MPHFSFEYSANLEDTVDINALCIRVRGFKAEHYSIADGNPEHAFLDLSIRLREGRPQDKKEAATLEIFEALKTFLQPALQQHSIALSMEMRDIDAKM